jgi:hypothetical protein
VCVCVCGARVCGVHVWLIANIPTYSETFVVRTPVGPRQKVLHIYSVCIYIYVYRYYVCANAYSAILLLHHPYIWSTTLHNSRCCYRGDLNVHTSM